MLAAGGSAGGGRWSVTSVAKAKMRRAAKRTAPPTTHSTARRMQLRRRIGFPSDGCEPLPTSGRSAEVIGSSGGGCVPLNGPSGEFARGRSERTLVFLWCTVELPPRTCRMRDRVFNAAGDLAPREGITGTLRFMERRPSDGGAQRDVFLQCFCFFLLLFSPTSLEVGHEPFPVVSITNNISNKND